MAYEITLKESGKKFRLKSLTWDMQDAFIDAALKDFSDPRKRRKAIRKMLCDLYGEKAFAGLKGSSADTMQVYYATMDISNGNKIEEEEKNS